MKKLILSAILTLSIVTAVIPFSLTEVKTINCDDVFLATVGGLQEVDDGEPIEAVRKPLYDINVNPLGYVYEYTLCGNEGYAVFIEEDGKFIAQEVMPNSKSPYAESEGQCVYVSCMNYLEFSDGEYEEAASGIKIPVEAVDRLKEEAVYGDGDIMLLSTTNVTYNYKSKEKSEYKMALEVPQCTSSPYVGACACIAGANIIAFYDRYFEDLIPNSTPGHYLSETGYIYYGETSSMTNVVVQLYADMGTTSSGTSEEQFKSGMQTFCNRLGYNVTFTSLMSDGELNYISLKNYVRTYYQPVALFLSGFNVAGMIEEDGKDSLGYYYSSENHIMVGFGFRQITYTYILGIKETVRFVYVASGESVNSSGYFNINFKTKINSAYAVKIY